MQVRWPDFLLPFLRLLGFNIPYQRNDLGAALDLIFKPRPPGVNCFDRTPGEPRGPGVYVTISGQAPYHRSRSENLGLSRTDIPALTVTANAGEVSVSGTVRADWSLRLCAYGDGSSETEAVDRSQKFSLTRIGSTVSLDGPRFEGRRNAGGELIVDGPADAPITVHGSFGSVQVCNMSGPVQATAIHGRARILNATGRVEASGFVVDFSGSQGAVTLSAEAEINIKFTSTRFEGTMMAWAQRSVRTLVARGFQTAFRAMVNRPGDFVCRTEFRKQIKHGRSGTLHVFTYDGDGSTAPDRVHLRSEHGTIVIDTSADS